MTLEEIYQKLPIPLQQVAVNVEGWRTVRRNYGGNFYNFLQEAEKRTFWPPEKIQFFRDQRLRTFVRHCYETVPYYRRLFGKIKITPDDIKTLDDLKIIPILTKEDVQDHFAEFISEAVPPRARILIKTSGTTGGAIHFYATKNAIQEQWATWWRFRRWHGIQLNMWCGQFTGNRIVPITQKNPPYWRYDFVGKRIHFSPLHMTSENLFFYVKEIKRKKLGWLHGYPSLLFIFATFLLDNNINFDNQIKFITIGGENLLAYQKETIKKAFGVYPLQHYGMSEAVANISECEFGNLHVDEDFAATEFIPITGSSYKVIGTNITNEAFPFLRYDVQDIVAVDRNQVCRCGRPGRLVNNIDGRQDDYIVLKNGNKLGGIDHFFKDIINVREIQLYQKVPGELIVKVVKGKDYLIQVENNLIREIRKRLGNHIDITVEYVSSIPRNPNNKFRFILSDIEDAKI